VDATNLVLLELGQPLHAFDLDKLEGPEIRVRRARPGEKLLLLDGSECQLTADQLVIADARKPVALAGVMGGAPTQITSKTRRVLLSDTLIDAFTPEEIEGVLAHELAHHRYRHITKMLLISAVGSWIAFAWTDALWPRWAAGLGLQGLSDIASFPALALWFSGLGLLALPVQNGLSRYFEWQADRFAVATTRLPRAFAEALRHLASLNLADPNPPRWVVWLFYDHPPIMERIAAAEQAATA